jgi:acyl-CoA thioester hydrolase
VAQPADCHLEALQIDADDIDHMGHVNNAVYLKWAQKTALSFWNAHATPDLVATRVWIARSHRIDYRRPAFIGDQIIGMLRFSEHRGARVLFDLDIMRENDLLARIQSWWCSIDATTHRPAAVAKAFLAGIMHKSD